MNSKADKVGEKIRIQRLMKNYSQEYMAFMLDISQPAYSKLERDETEVSLRRIYEISEILEISPFILMPKPKYSSGINQDFILRTMNKLRKLWLSHTNKRREAALAVLNHNHSDTSNIQHN